MPRKHPDKVIQVIRTLAGAPSPEEASDAQLLERFAARRDERAFAVLLERHGRLVLGVCRRVLRHVQDAEDAFQATFLVLARKAAWRGWSDSVAGWLYAVAQRVARKARAAARRRARETALVEAPPVEPDAAPGRELGPLLDEELNRLPQRYRAPLVLCYLEGKTNEEAARQLGRPVGTVWYQLSRGRELLRDRLSRRGVALSAAAIGAALAGEAAAAAAPEALLTATLQAAAGPAAVAGEAAAPVAALVKGVLQEMFFEKLKPALAALLILAAAGLGASAAYQALPGGRTESSKAGPSESPAAPDKPAEKPREPAPDKPAEKPKETGKTVPAGAPLEARLVVKQAKYTLDRGGQTAEAYAAAIHKAAKAGFAVPAPEVDLVLELRNTGREEIKVLIGGDAAELVLDLKGPGAVSVRPNIPTTLEFRGPQEVAIAPGKSQEVPVAALAYGNRLSTLAYWTRPGEYTLTATYLTAVSPAPKGARTWNLFPGFGEVSATSAPVKLEVVEKK
jgi:RNA polymerase sigma factor (sigma-70 family)